MSPDLIRALRDCTLQLVPVVLGPRDEPKRSLYWTPSVKRWCENADGSQHADDSMLAPKEELNQAFADFVSGRPLAGGFTRCDPPAGQGIWKLHTNRIRLFGWCVEPQCMVITHVEWAGVLKAHGKPTYRELAQEVVKQRRLLGFRDYHNGDIRSAFPASR
jgi:hypothetical protein